MNEQTIQQYYADAPPTVGTVTLTEEIVDADEGQVVTLAIKPHFEALTEQQKRYAHHLSRSVRVY